jgi:mono/diheme cytochrome c family protein
VNRNDVILGIVAAVLVGFSLFVSIVVPRRRPDFPGRSLRVFVLVSALLVVGMLTAVAVLGESHHFASEGGDTGGVTNQPPTATTTPTPSPTETGQQPAGDAAAGKEIFTTTAQPSCSTCHTLKEAGATQTIGPNLDEVLKGKDAAFIHQSIVDPNAEVATGYQPGIMPEIYSEQLDEKQLADLVAFLVEATKS